MHNIRELFKLGIKILRENPTITTPELDSRIILQGVLNCSHEYLLLHQEKICQQQQIDNFFQNIAKRKKNFPIAYIIGKKEFFGKEFFVNKHTLIPRPDTEILIDTCIENFSKDQEIEILDIGTGSGCIAITLADYFIHSKVLATDCSLEALKVAQKNASHHQIKIEFLYNNNFAEGIKGNFDLIISNPPYIEATEIKNLIDDVKNYEPQQALNGGESGIKPYEIIANQAKDILAYNGFIIVEIGINQEKEIENIFYKHGFKLVNYKKDLAQITRCLCFKKFNLA